MEALVTEKRSPTLMWKEGMDMHSAFCKLPIHDSENNVHIAM
jgi:hypothetical protein